jgi:hypothetical protein
MRHPLTIPRHRRPASLVIAMGDSRAPALRPCRRLSPGRRWNLAFVEMNQRLFLRPPFRHFGKRGSPLLRSLSGAA